MTYALERQAIEAYFAALWGATTPIGYDGQTFAPVADSVRLTINSGAVLQGSVGRVANQRLHVGTLVVAIYTDGAKGSVAWRGYAQTIIAGLTDKRLQSSGALATTAANVFLRFSPPQLAPNEHPYISASFKSAPFHITNVTAPFVRYSYG